MTGRSMIAVAVLFTFAVAGCASSGTRGGRAGLADVPEARKVVKLSEKQYTDDKGRKLVVRDDGSGKERVHAFDAQGKEIDITEIPLTDTEFCAAKAKPKCQPVTFVSDGAFIKMGTESCYCYSYWGTLYCYGDTCR
jgi:hypothetical protein